MLDIVWAGVIVTLKVIGILVFGWFFYWRVIDYAHAVSFYGRQGKDVCALVPGHLPFIGNVI